MYIYMYLFVAGMTQKKSFDAAKTVVLKHGNII